MQLSLFPENIEITASRKNSCINKIDNSDRYFHEWYRFVLSFPPHLVQEYIKSFALKPGNIILDPFCGTGTTLVEAKLNGISSIGIEANAMAYYASSTKVDWGVDPDGLVEHAVMIAKKADGISALTPESVLKTLPPEAHALLLKDSISPLPLHKALALLEQLDADQGSRFERHEKLALAKALVFSSSNLHFGPEVGVLRTKKQNAPVIEAWLAEVKSIAADLRKAPHSTATAIVHRADARQLATILEPCSIDAVFTSPPYPNEKDYTRTTRLESVVLGFIRNKEELRAMKKGLLRSNTRNVYKGDDDDIWIAENKEIQEIAAEIENRRIAMGKTSGFERLYAKVTKLYFGGIARHLAQLRACLKPGAYLGYVVGDQASYLQVMIQTGQLIADIATVLGYRVVSIDLFRTRLATATQKQMREEVVVLQWPGAPKGVSQ